jgi:hypothetical protein
MNKPLQSHYNEKLKLLDDESLKYIYNCNTISSRATMYLLAGIEPAVDRMKDLQTLFSLHIRNLHADNPMKRLISYYERRVIWGPDKLIPRLNLPTDDLKCYQSLPPLPDSGRPPHLRTWVKQLKLKRLLQTPGKLHHYIEHHHTVLKTNPCLKISDVSTRKAAISWRLNKLFTRRTCYCGQLFHRGCFNNCDYMRILYTAIPTIPDYLTEIQEWHQSLHHKLQEQGIQYEGHYTMLDHLLNKKKFNLFKDAIHAIQTVIWE